jgi:hypothetical protein
MEDAGGQFGPVPETNPTTEATANDVVQSKKVSGSFQGQMADASAGGSSFWRQKQLEIVNLITSQEDASNQLSSGISVDGFRVARTRGTTRWTQGFERRGLNVGDLGSQ